MTSLASVLSVAPFDLDFGCRAGDSFRSEHLILSQLGLQRELVTSDLWSREKCRWKDFRHTQALPLKFCEGVIRAARNRELEVLIKTIAAASGSRSRA